MKENIKMVKKMEKEYMILIMEINMIVNLKMDIWKGILYFLEV